MKKKYFAHSLEGRPPDEWHLLEEHLKKPILRWTSLSLEPLSHRSKRRFWTMIAHSHGQLWNASKTDGSLEISAPTARSYLDILEETFIVWQIQPYRRISVF